MLTRARAVLLGAALLWMGSALLMAGCANEPAPQTEAPQTEAPAVATSDPIASGKASYDQYCMGCHGADGTGTGTLGADLASMPADLTQLQRQNEGVFPVDAVFQTIDGRQAVEAHGTREMPVWGNIWEEQDGQHVEEEVVERRINELVEYIRSIQQ